MDDFRKVVRQRASAKSRLRGSSDDWCFGVCSSTVRYDVDLETCVAAARTALGRLDLIVTGGDLRSSEARIDARSELSELVRIAVTASEQGGCSVSFSAGREWTQEGKHLISSLREAFECCLNDQGRPKP